MNKTILKQYKSDIEFIEGLSNIPRKNYLLGGNDRSIFINRIKKFLNLLGDPQDKLKFVHIAGTSGKGTTVNLLHNMILDAGLKVASYTSPFATTTIEKVRVNEKFISPKDLHEILENKIKPALDEYILKYKDDPISYFETWLAIALLHFETQKCDWVVLEAGLGGQHDATNVIKNTKMAAITNIGLDHTEVLGNSKEKIATDKAGIIKKNCLFLTTEKNKKLQNIFHRKCQKEKAWHMTLDNLTENYKLSEYFDTPKQKDNLNLVLNILSVLKIKPQKTQKVINDFKLICRQEIIQKNPMVILDGSHNKDKLDNLINFLEKQNYRKLHLIIGFSFDKNFRASFKKLLAMSDSLHITRFIVSGRKTADLRALYKTADSTNPKLAKQIYNDPYQALAGALKKAGKNDLVLVTGSFFLAGELRKNWISEEYILKNLKFDKK